MSADDVVQRAAEVIYHRAAQWRYHWQPEVLAQALYDAGLLAEPKGDQDCPRCNGTDAATDLYQAARRLLALCATRAPLPGEGRE